jgi:hypothetical protein
MENSQIARSKKIPQNSDNCGRSVIFSGYSGFLHRHYITEYCVELNIIKHHNPNPICAVPDLPLCLGVLKHMTPLDRGPISLPICLFTMDFCLCDSILNLKAFCFGAISNIMIELIVYGSVPHSGPK